MEALGMLGGLLLAVSAIPQVVKSWKDGHSEGLSHGLLALWLGGEACMLMYVLVKYTSDLWLLLNYGSNFLFVGVIAWFKYWPRVPEASESANRGPSH